LSVSETECQKNNKSPFVTGMYFLLTFFSIHAFGTRQNGFVGKVQAGTEAHSDYDEKG
jgi:hypothetical protein